MHARTDKCFLRIHTVICVLNRPGCDYDACILPDCFCTSDSTVAPKYHSETNRIPQMIMMTFDDAVNIQNIDIYKKLFLSNRYVSFSGARQ